MRITLALLLLFLSGCPVEEYPQPFEFPCYHSDAGPWWCGDMTSDGAD